MSSDIRLHVNDTLAADQTVEIDDKQANGLGLSVFEIWRFAVRRHRQWDRFVTRTTVLQRIVACQCKCL